MKYKVLLVDDESIALRGLEQLIDWNELNCLISGTAYSAVAALEIITDIEPDIVITDLVMPEMDGIEFISILNQRYPNIEIIILSGYGEFEYAQQAIKNNVCEFLVKPVTEGELKEAVIKVSGKIAERARREQSIEEQRELLNRSIPLLKNQYILDILKGKITDEEEARNKSAMIGFQFLQMSSAAILHSDDNNCKGDIITNLLLKEHCEEYFEEICQAGIVMDGDFISILLSGSENSINDYVVFNTLEKLRESILKKFGISVTIGVSQCFNEIEDASGAYSAAYDAFMSRFFLGLGQVIHHSVAVENIESGIYPYEIVESVISKIKFQENVDANELANELIEAFVNASGYSIDTIYQYCYQFCIRLFEVLQSMNDGNLENANHSLPGELKKIRSKTSVDELKSLLLDAITQEVKLIDSIRKRKAGSIIEKVKQYICENLSEDLTLNAVATIAFMNPTYFSIFFKQSTGINYHDYVFEEKMKYSKRLLIEEQMKIYEVSEKVGYLNPRSFTDAFRRYWGKTPTSYIKSFYSTRK